MAAIGRPARVDPQAGPRRRGRPLAPGSLAPAVLAVALLAPALAGCLTLKSDPEPLAQPGDFVVTDLVREVRSPDGGVAETRFEDARVYLGEALPQDPGAFPDGWDPNATRTAVPGLVAAMDGMRAGETRSTGWLSPQQAYGVRDPRWVDVFDRAATLPRTLADTPVGGDGTVAAYGRTWDATAVDADGDGAADDARLDLADGDVGAVVEHPDFWGADVGLWRSEVVAFNATHLTVRHLAEDGDTVTRGSVEGRIAQVNASAIVVDRNPPLAGREVRFEATLVEIVFTRPGRVRAPDFELRTLEGEIFRLSAKRGRPVLLYFFATWCTVCKQQTPEVLTLEERFGADVSVLAVSIDPNERPDAVRDYEAQYVDQVGGGRNVSFAVDDRAQLGHTYTVITIPKMVLVDDEGFLAWRGQGHVPADAMGEEVERAQTG